MARRRSADVNYGSAWHTLLVGGLGGGGKGVYALDVTDPSTFSEANANSIVRWEFSDADDADLGYMFGQPLLVKTNNGRWSVIVGNGYNSNENHGHGSGNGHAVLFVLDAETGAVVKKIDTNSGSNGTPNGLSGPIGVDTTGDGTVDAVYAGDLFGNLWKFDLTSGSASGWLLALGGSPLYRTGGQPITMRPDVTKFPAGGYLVTFGTGSYIDTNDSGTTSIQAFYGIRDTGVAVAGISSLVQQSVAGTASGADSNTYRITTHAVGAPTLDTALAGDNRISIVGLQHEQEGLVSEPADIRRARRDGARHSRGPRRVQHADPQHRPVQLRRQRLGDGSRRADRQPLRLADLRHQRRSHHLRRATSSPTEAAATTPAAA